MRVHPRPFGVLLRLGELMCAVPVAFALMPQRLQGAGLAGGRCVVQQRCAERLVFMSCGVLAPPHRQRRVWQTGLFRKHLLISRWTASML